LILKGVKKPARARGEFPDIFQAVLQSLLLAPRFAHPTNGTHSMRGSAVWVYQQANALGIVGASRFQGPNIRRRARRSLIFPAYTCPDTKHFFISNPAL
jgi:hypothetical protein